MSDGVSMTTVTVDDFFALLKDAERYRYWRKNGIELVNNGYIGEVTGDELDKFTDHQIDLK